MKLINRRRDRRGWELPERYVTPEAAMLNRRALLGGAGLIAAGLLAGSEARAAQTGDAVSLPFPRNDRFEAGRALTAEAEATTYNNFYEFGTSKSISRAADRLRIKPWTVTIDGLVEQPLTLDAEALIARLPREERIYRHRCVEAWSMVVPWSGAPLAELVKLVRPQGSAKYVRFETFNDAGQAPGQRQFWYPWPYVEGVTIAEAANELPFLATGVYGKPLPNSMGAPIRLVLPWKYGFKSIKSITRISFTETQPKTFWEALGPSEYGFWANVNPKVAHPRWSQAQERVLGTGETAETQLFNGYAPYVADLYKGLTDQKLYM